MTKLLFDYTPTGVQFPNFLRVQDDEHGHIKIAVRDHAQMVETESGADLEPGQVHSIVMDKAQALALAEAIYDRFGVALPPRVEAPEVKAEVALPDEPALLPTFSSVADFADAEYVTPATPIPVSYGRPATNR